ncbi:type II secretion system F family protein [Pseudonocardia sp. ICBG1293]|uniref:type II secretion system F family protein n=1 Tax=Pseudonocardia sp. ICBG1293 TaxID=2844382 RepID=UPI001CCBCBB6|nr:type II secretion system F family protein [Pseudonocardia sp. ICBG1293]
MTAAALGLAALALAVAGGRPGTGRLRGLRAVARVTATAAPPRTAVLAVLVPAGAAFGAAVTGAGGAVTGAAVGAGLWWLARHTTRRAAPTVDSADLAAAWDLLATCLAAGLAVADAVGAAARRLDGPAGDVLRRVAGLLALGADPEDAWAAAGPVPELAGFARAAGRSARTGAVLGRSAAAEAARLRAGLADLAEERAQRAAVRITAPLGLCFLPAFLILGIVPVVIGLAGEAFARW